jgi:hypothetical protein
MRKKNTDNNNSNNNNSSSGFARGWPKPGRDGYGCLLYIDIYNILYMYIYIHVVKRKKTKARVGMALVRREK